MMKIFNQILTSIIIETYLITQITLSKKIMISQTQTASNQYGFYAVPKKLQPKKKYRQQEYSQIDTQQQQEQFQTIQRSSHPEHLVERDFYVNEPPFPQFKPKEKGLDYGVQVERGQLIDFDIEVQPLLEILVGRSVVSAFNQLQEEKEIVDKKDKLQVYQKKRNAQLMVTQRLQAKSKRKQEQSQRRVLQKQIFTKNQRQAASKVIARRAGKHSLLGLGSEVIQQLQQCGYLRSQPYTNLRIDYQGWLYEQITRLITQDSQITQTLRKMINEVEDDEQNEHKKKIQKEKHRRQDIVNQRQRLRKENQQRKEKKRLKRLRKEMNLKREPLVIKFDETLEKYHQVDNILRQEHLSNGWVAPNSNTNALYVSGGIINFIIALLNSTQQIHYSSDQLEEIITKLLSQLHTPLEIDFSQQHYQLIQQQILNMNSNPNDFMIDKVERVADLTKNVSMNLRLFELTRIKVKSILHESLLQAIFNIVLTSTAISKTQEQQQLQTFYSPTQQDKHRQQAKKKLSLKPSIPSQFQQLSTILRVRFQRKQPSQNKSQNNQQQSKNQSVQPQEQWIDIYDGQGWGHRKEELPQQINREMQKPALLSIHGFENAFVYDERVLYFLRKEVQRLFDIEAGADIEKYSEGLANLATLIGKNVPVLDSELKMVE